MARHDTRFRLFHAIVGGAAWWLTSGSARAYDEQASLDLALGYALAVDDDVSAQGASVDVGGSIGLSDVIVARALLGYAGLLEDRHGQRDAQHLGRLRMEGLYLLDVLKVVPFFGLGITLTNNPHDAASLPVRPGGHLVFGVDYLASRGWTFGLDVRAALLLEGDGQMLNATDVALRLSRMFETF